MKPDDLRRLLPLYDLPTDAQIRLLNRSENETWMVGNDALVLRVHRAGYHSHAEIMSELAWLAALRRGTVLRCVCPVADASGALLQAIDGRHVVAFEPIAAREVQATDDLAQWFGPLGEITAHLHAHAQKWPRPADFTRKRWDIATILGPDPHWGHWKDAPGLEPQGATVLQRLAQDLTGRLRGYGSGPAEFGLIHADLRLANLMVDDAGIWAIDFDDCGLGWWMYDLAAAFSFIETDPRVGMLIDLWCGGYSRAGTISDKDRAILPVLILLRRLLLTAWIGSRADSDTAASLGGADYTGGTVTLAERFLSVGPARMFD